MSDDEERGVDVTLDAPLSLASSARIEVPHLGSATLLAGQRFADRYELQAELGRGGMGVVYRARDGMLGGEEVALKVLFADAGSAASIERFRREVRLARRITSPHVARTHDLGEHAGIFFLTMELVEGESLARRLHRFSLEGKRFSTREALRIARAIAEGLSAAHSADVVHRDLKPDNVLLSEGGRVVVTDFGIARAFRGPEALRATQGIAGTPAYMAPEQLEGKTTDARSDLYALGILLYECLTGELPFLGDTPIAAALARLHQSPRRLDPSFSLPVELEDVVHALLSRQPEGRPSTARELIEMLDGIEGMLGEPSSISGLARPTPRPTPQPRVTPHPTRSSVRADVGIVVMLFEHRGPPNEASVTSGVRDELIDVLSRTQSVRVVGRGMVDGIAAMGSDLRTYEERFGARYAVDAGIQVAAGGLRLRASVRLIEVATGVQAWSEVVELEVSDPFVASERMAFKIAEALRLALEVSAYEGKVSREALEAYRQARKTVRGAVVRDPSVVLAQLDRVIRDAPGFAPPLALYALACVRFWFTPQLREPRDWHAETAVAIARALESAGHLAETRFAAASLAWQEVRLHDAVSEARAALAIAPSYPDAMAFLGQLELEVGRPMQGLERLAWARDLEPTLRVTIFEPARWQGLYGDIDAFRRLLKVIRDELREEPFAGQLLVRVGAWRGDEAMIREGIAVLSRVQNPVAAPLTNYGRAILGEAEVVELPAAFLAVASPRLQTVAIQMQAEAHAKLGRRDEALGFITRASSIALTDLEWIDKCPFFVDLRDTPTFREARLRVFGRCEEIWLAA